MADLQEDPATKMLSIAVAQFNITSEDLPSQDPPSLITYVDPIWFLEDGDGRDLHPRSSPSLSLFLFLAYLYLWLLLTDKDRALGFVISIPAVTIVATYTINSISSEAGV